MENFERACLHFCCYWSAMQSLDFMGAERQWSSQMSDAEVYLDLKNIWKAACQIVFDYRHVSSKCNQGQLKLCT